MCILHSIFGYPKPDGLIGCFYCGRRTAAELGIEGPRERVECGWCNAAFERIVLCPRCGWEHGVRDGNHYAFHCDGCGEDICSLGFKIAQAYLNSLGVYLDE